MFTSRMFSATATAFSLFIAAGCQSSIGHGSQGIARSERAVTFIAGNGGATTILIPSADDNHAEHVASVESEFSR